ncbi:AraC family transcriptional activator of pobA [Parabacteroides sp. PF5-5]|uniref:helix-turn-helix domain-containing protein n=1 Tax=unclassified Parabacteroides TaxID=2649774 RepID=UPI0024745E11|nr:MULTISPECIES: AraC family transcriptional regulator [unclassified Parabacteroides]MDH6304874.1 AraC family transcriptional activator of pobA [Parabacteroides sp. PH5-39]MDH6316040.1 AraC family transcriptional activator of pobA [Parabacteroides sp. PF5-13]MDH6319697.1 AraC family transcriptional activator of pobA [Parabacteroides sp. PH5-13]MDH6323428.1 AraC family transcriptional activator of pobA [Parabacteroides sp. PH5-8]MDH6327064.1 AraC family transcriptional activator of pobA [Paraba
MKTIYTVGVNEFKKLFTLYDNFEDKVILIDLSKYETNDYLLEARLTTIRLTTLTCILVLKGTMKIYVDYRPYDLSSNCFLILMPSHTLQIEEASSDFQAKMLLLDLDFIQENRPEHIHPSIANLMEIRNNPIVELLQGETKLLISCMELIKEKIHLRAHLLQKEVIKNALVAFSLEMVNILMVKKEQFHTHTMSRQDEILNKFLTLLLEHCKEEHEVSFYAEQLFITPQYLSLVLKNATGSTANKLIDKAIMAEAKILLRSNEYSIQQIADILHFSDQSAFGKFFKRHTNMSPAEYKKK